MNAIFTFILLLSTAIILIFEPDKLTGTLQNGAYTSIEFSLKMLALYAVWLSVFEILNRTGLCKKFSKLLNMPVKLIFGKTSKKSQELLSLNLSANMLGIGAIATKTGIEATALLDKEQNTFAQNVLLVISATSIQILPISVIALRSTFNSVSPSDVFLPTLITTMFTTILGYTLVRVFQRKK